MKAQKQSSVGEAELRVADTIGQLMQFWGFKRPMGRLWTLLYLSPVPLGAAELGRRLSMSAGAVSMGLSALTKWSAVKKSWQPGERRDFYEAETSIWKLVRRVIQERELSLVREVAESLASAENVLAASGDKSGPIRFKRERVAQLRRLAEAGERLLTALAAGKAVDPTPISEGLG